MGFGEAGRSFGSAIDFFQEKREQEKKKGAIREYVTRQLARLPPEKQMEAQALLSAPEGASEMPGPTPMPASTLMDGVPDAPIPPEIPGMQGGSMGSGPAPIDDLFAPPATDLSSLAQPKEDPGTESLRMLLEATRDDVMEPKGLFDYIAGMGKQDMVGSGRMDLEGYKAGVRRDIQQNDIAAKLDRLERLLANRKELNDDDNTTSTANNERTNKTRVDVTDKANKTRKDIAGNRPAGKGGKDPDAMTQDEIDAELGVYQERVDSLAVAGGDPKAVGYKPAEERFATIDEGARQKDLSKNLDRVTALKAAKARKLAGGGATQAPAPAAPGAGGGKVYTSKADIKADLASGALQPGSKVQFQMPDGSTVLVNTGR